jgi:basic membrane protein A
MLPAYNRGFVLGVKAVNASANVWSHTPQLLRFLKATSAHSQIRSGADILTGSSQQALGGLRAVADYRDKDIWWVGPGPLQSLPRRIQGTLRPSYNYAAVINTLVKRRDAGFKAARTSEELHKRWIVFTLTSDEEQVTSAVEAKVTKHLQRSRAGRHARSRLSSV